MVAHKTFARGMKAVESQSPPELREAARRFRRAGHDGLAEHCDLYASDLEGDYHDVDSTRTQLIEALASTWASATMSK